MDTSSLWNIPIIIIWQIINMMKSILMNHQLLKVVIMILLWSFYKLLNSIILIILMILLPKYVIIDFYIQFYI